MKRFFLIAILAASGSTAQAAYFDQNANDYYDRCHSKENIICAATAGAYLDMMSALGYKCASDTGVNRVQVKDVLLQYLVNHPEHRNAPLPFSAILAFQSAFGCRAAGQK